MIIANPIYDLIFKRWMENERVAKFFIGTLMEETLKGIDVKPQKFTNKIKLAVLVVFRLDSVAMLKFKEMKQKKYA
jgi:hypothetical protein